MMNIYVHYKRLCDEFLLVAQSYMDLNKLSELKTYYESPVDSKRQLSSVVDLKTLLKLLEKRDVLNYRDIDPLYHIARNYVDNTALQNKLNVYKNWCEKNDNKVHLGNMYIDQSDDSSSQEDETSDRVRVSNVLHTTEYLGGFLKDEHFYSHQRLPSTVQKSVANSKEAQLQQTVLHFVSERIGRSWRDVVRHLDVTEAKIDEVQLQWPNDVKEQCYQALRYWLSTCYNSDKWKVNLMQALAASRRKDLQEDVARMVL